MSLAAGGLSIGALFHYARQTAREAKLNQMRAQTMSNESQRRAVGERMARQANLQRMRSIAQTQLGGMLAQSGVPFGGGLYGATGGVPMSAHISQAAGMRMPMRGM